MSDARVIEYQANERYSVPREITWRLMSPGYSGVEVFGTKLGTHLQNGPLPTADFKMPVMTENKG